jgi:DNA-binding Xre family transcriptional regulator
MLSRRSWGMQDREYSLEKLLITAVSELGPDAGTRIRKAQRIAVDGLLENTLSAWKRLIEVCERRALAGSSTRGERLAALNAAQRAYRNAKIEAYHLVCDAVAAEYLQMDDPEAFSDRLTEFVLPLVCRSLPKGDDDRFTLAAIRTRVLDWESRTAKPTSRRPKRERPAQIIDRLRFQKGSWTIEHLAEVAGLAIKQIYKVKREQPVQSSTIAKLARALGCHAADLIPVLPPSKASAKHQIC